MGFDVLFRFGLCEIFKWNELAWKEAWEFIGFEVKVFVWCQVFFCLHTKLGFHYQQQRRLIGSFRISYFITACKASWIMWQAKTEIITKGTKTNLNDFASCMLYRTNVAQHHHTDSIQLGFASYIINWMRMLYSVCWLECVPIYTQKNLSLWFTYGSTFSVVIAFFVLLRIFMKLLSFCHAMGPKSIYVQ